VRRRRLGLRMDDPPRSRSPPVRVSYGNPRQVIRQRGPTIRRRLLWVLLGLGACPLAFASPASALPRNFAS
jgi:hypothetical protein